MADVSILLNMTGDDLPRQVDQMGQIALMILALALVLVLAYYTTRFLGTRGQKQRQGRLIQIKETLYVGKDKAVFLLEVGERYYLVGTTNQSMNLLGAIEKDELPAQENEPAEEGTPGLQGAFFKLFESMRRLRSAPEDLRKAREQHKPQEEAPIPEEEEAPPVEGGPVEQDGVGLRLVRRQPRRERAPGEAAPPQVSPRQPSKRRTEKLADFAQSLQQADEKYLRGELGEPEDVIVELSEDAARRKAPAKKKPPRGAGGAEPHGMGAGVSKEDEIDRMMQSIEQRTQQIKARRLQEDDDDEQE